LAANPRLAFELARLEALDVLVRDGLAAGFEAFAARVVPLSSPASSVDQRLEVDVDLQREVEESALLFLLTDEEVKRAARAQGGGCATVGPGLPMPPSPSSSSRSSTPGVDSQTPHPHHRPLPPCARLLRPSHRLSVADLVNRRLLEAEGLSSGSRLPNLLRHLVKLQGNEEARLAVGKGEGEGDGEGQGGKAKGKAKDKGKGKAEAGAGADAPSAREMTQRPQAIPFGRLATGGLPMSMDEGGEGGEGEREGEREGDKEG
jgi:hypothetical protein